MGWCDAGGLDYVFASVSAAHQLTSAVELELALDTADFDEAGFSVDGQRFDGAGHAIYFTVHHPDAAGTGLTVYYGNSEAALSNASILDYYPNSLLVFETPEGAEPSADGMPHAKVVLRKDFEFPDRLEL